MPWIAWGVPGPLDPPPPLATGLILCALQIYLLTYLLTYIVIIIDTFDSCRKFQPAQMNLVEFHIYVHMQ